PTVYCDRQDVLRQALPRTLFLSAGRSPLLASKPGLSRTNSGLALWRRRRMAMRCRGGSALAAGTPHTAVNLAVRFALVLFGTLGGGTAGGLRRRLRAPASVSPWCWRGTVATALGP